MSFVANQGQTDPRVQFLSQGNGYTLFLTASEAVFGLQTAAVAGGLSGAGGGSLPVPSSAAVIRMQLVGANSGPPSWASKRCPG